MYNPNPFYMYAVSLIRYVLSRYVYISLYNRSFSAFSNETQETDDDEMNISQEILVLDFGDEKSDFLRSETDFGKGTPF